MEDTILKMPRMIGSFCHFGRFLPPVSHSSMTISPDTCRTAIAVRSGPRIITPSISA
jgi:hypothetical protein